MTHDPLDDWLKTPSPRPEPQRIENPFYEAFRPLDRRQDRLRICPRHQPWEWLPYATLIRIVTEADYGTRLALIWAFAVVVIEGRNLQALDYAVAHGHVDFIREYDPKRFPQPTDKAAPFIEKITIHVQDIPETSEKLLEAGKKRH